MQSNDEKPWKPYLSKNDVEWLAELSQAQSTSTVAEMLDDGETLLCTLYSEIDRMLFSNGKADHLEQVTLQREPFGHFNTIRVENKDGKIVGYIERSMTEPLAEIMDRQLARIEAIVQQDLYTFGVKLEIWCKLKNYQHVSFILQNLSFTRNDLSKEVDRLFESLPEGDKTSMAEAAPAVKTALYPHQKQALHWMISRENDNILPPFWEEQSNGTYYNTVDKSTVKKRPKSIKGGLLADDMGLGKTLTTIALILTNSADKKPLVELNSSCQMLPVQIKEENLLDFAEYGGNMKMVNNLSDVDPHPSTSKTNEDCEAIEITDSFQEDDEDIDNRDKNEQDDVPSTPKIFSLTAKSNRKHRLSRITDSDDTDGDTDDDTSRKKNRFQNSFTRGKGKKKRVCINLFPEKSESRPCKRDSKDSDYLPSASNSPISNQICDSDSCSDDYIPYFIPVENDDLSSPEPARNGDLPALEPVKDCDELLSNEEDAVTRSEVHFHKTPNMWGECENKVICRKQSPEKSKRMSCKRGGEDSDYLPSNSNSLLSNQTSVSDSCVDNNDLLEPEENDEFASLKTKENEDLPSLEQSESDLSLFEPNKSDLLSLESNKSDLSSFELKESDLSSFELKESDLSSPEPKESDLSSFEPVRNSDLPSMEPVQNGNGDSPSLEPARNGDSPSLEPARNGNGDSPSLEPARNGDSPSLEPARNGDSPSLEPARNGNGDSPSLEPARKGDSPSLKTARNGDSPSLEPARNGNGDSPSLEPARNGDSPSLESARNGDLPSLEPARNGDLPALEPVKDCDELLSNEEDAVTYSETEDEFDSLRANATLIICPLSVMDIWKMEIEEHVHPDVHLNVYTYHGSKRLSEILKYCDIVFTTYDMVASDYKRRSQKTHTILDVPWLRIILDEGHLIRNSRTLKAKAVKELKAERKWILTGTPIQNSIHDLGSLVSFLNIPHLTNSVLWRDAIATPIERGDTSALKHVQHLLANIAMRRTKNQKVDGKPLVQLPNKTEITERIKFSEEERNIYDRIFTEGREMIRQHFEDNTVLSNFADIFYVLLHLRQICCHIWLNAELKHLTQDGSNDSEDEKTRRKAIAILKSGSDEECSICLDRIKSPVVTQCAHIFCQKCIQDVIDKQKSNTTCPLCRKDLSQDDLIEVNLDDDETPFVIPDNWKSSAKIDALMKSLIKLREEDVKIKSVVVSQFTKFLDLIEIPLRHNGFKFGRLDGKMSPPARKKAIQTFMDESPDSPTIFLLSLKAGGLGLNLIAASRMFVMEPAWNPASENQCYDRIYRLGQKNDVIITKFIIEDSIEERMCALQEKKRELMKGIFKMQTNKERRSDRIAFIRSLLNL